ncbi:unnamed protein product [Sympodiomycopsis kandeliae]
MLALAIALALWIACLSARAQQNTSSSSKILLYTKTAGYRHDSIPAAIDVITKLGTGDLQPNSQYTDPSVQGTRWTTVQSEDEGKFDDSNYLGQFDAVVFAFTTDVDPPGRGTVLSDQGVQNLYRYIQNGGNFVGIHSATTTLYAHPAYGRLVGGFFTYHAQSQDVTLKPLVRDHPAVSHLPDTFNIKEEMYHHRSAPTSLPAKTEVLLTNATAYQDPGGTQNEGSPQPLSWARTGSLLSTSDSLPASSNLTGEANISGGDGRAWITTLGHEINTWSSDVMRAHVYGGVAWALQNSKSNGKTSSGDGSQQMGERDGAKRSVEAIGLTFVTSVLLIGTLYVL